MQKNGANKRQHIFFVFTIESDISLYSKCFKFISKIEQDATIINSDDINFKIEIFQNTDSNKNDKKCIEQIEYKKKKNQLNKLEPDPNRLKNLNNFIKENEKNKSLFRYYFRIDYKKQKEKQQDIVQLQYFALIRRMYENKCYLSIISSDEGYKKRFSYYMLFESLSKLKEWKIYVANLTKKKYKLTGSCLEKNFFYNNVYFIDISKAKLKISRLDIHGIGSLNKFLPLIRIDRSSYYVFSNTVEDYFKSFENVSNESDNSSNIDRDYIYKIHKEYFSNQANSKTDIKDENEFNINLYELIIKDICIDLLKDSRVLNKDKEENEKKYKLFKNMSMLSFLFFSVFCKYVKKESKDIDSQEIKSILQASQDFADGALQLIENVINYAKEGYLSFRIHGKNSSYLENNYKEYELLEDYYIELIISDLNDKFNIPNQFIFNLKNQSENKEICPELKEKMIKRISLSNFFEPDKEMQKLWTKFYEYPNNITNHYGLQIFDSSVKSHKGFFRVKSSKGFEIKKNEFYVRNYNPKKNFNNNDYEKWHLPGTQYRVLLPLRKRDEQKRVGLNISLNYKDESLNNDWKEVRISSKEEIKELTDDYTDSIIKLTQEGKKQKINQVASTLCEKYNDKHFYVIEVMNINKTKCIEILSKALISFITKNKESMLRIALIGASNEFIINFTRCFSVFYNKVGECASMENVHIYACNNTLSTEVVFEGKTIESALYTSEFLANAKGEFNECLDIMSGILNNRVKSNLKDKDTISIIPFDILIKDGNMTIFEKK
ncbi:hypothetical protein RBH29_15130 [Herbivorax sp. ANBcel31]|uniref:hypothetical protein n=1 Tax=Herbivorax sp. ANBcel31 TaxID=3069754 RepID=UPI0027AFCAF2|nr:hypothetical protein [Herbivorax sp. ANBcel31]MDQ2087762.1 hypothetical protein [Herbivorax sp. ANBcel31]